MTKYFVLIITTGFIIFFLGFDKPVEFKENNNLEIELENVESQIAPSKIPDELFFAGERIPLENFDVSERLDRELLVNKFWRSSTFLIIKRANRYFPTIERILAKNNVPDDLKYIAVIESNLSNVVSPAGATGFWQIIKSTGLSYGLEIDDEIDERYHLEKSTEAACKYLIEAKQKFGSWINAAASYNMGMAGLNKQMEKQKSDNYFNLVLNDETTRYVFRFLALKLIMENPENYGYKIEKEDLYSFLDYYTINVDTSISHLADFAFSKDCDYKTLKIFNPWLRDNYLSNPKGKNYIIKLPVKGSVQLIND